MAVFLFADNARSTLAGPITGSATSITLNSGTGALFPAPAAGQQFALTLNDQATGTLYEVAYCTARSGDVLTVVRGQEGTTARAWALGDFCWNGPTSGQQNSFVQYPHMTDASIAPTFGPTTVEGNIQATGTGYTGGTSYSAQGFIAEGWDGAGAQWRAIAGSYGAMLRNDGTTAYLLSTAGGNQYGTWNGFRPFYWNLGSGAVTIDATGVGAYFGGNIWAQSGSVTTEYVHSTGNVQADGSLITNNVVDAALDVVAGRNVFANGAGFFEQGVTALNFTAGSTVVVSEGINLFNGNGWYFNPPSSQLVAFRSDGLNMGYFDGGANFHVFGTVAFPNYSDIRLKYEVEPFTRGLADMKKVQAIRFRWNGQGGTYDDGRLHFGVSAQDVQEHLPEAVSVTGEPPHRDETRHRIDSEKAPRLRLENQLEFDKDAILMALVNAVKELSDMNDELAGRLQALEAGR